MSTDSPERRGDASPPNDTPSAPPDDLPGDPAIIPREDHCLTRRDISSGALKVLYRLHNKGFRGFLVGGGVRDLLLGKKPKDFDVGTDARPTRLKKIFKNCRIIGRRFRIAHIYFNDEEVVEVATFRRGEVSVIEKKSGVVLLDNQYGTPEEDAKRRDLTINGLFYDIGSFSVIDYVGGVKDLRDRVIRTIKAPDDSFQEDPVRMIRALRHAARIDFRIEENTLQSIYRNREEIRKTNISRLMEELFKDLRSGAAVPFFRKLVETHLLDCFLPTLASQIREYGIDHPLFRRLEVLDERARRGESFTNAVLVAVLLHTVLIPVESCWQDPSANPPGVWPMLQRGYQEVGEHLRVSRRDQERVAQILLAYRKLTGFAQRRELSHAYQRKTYLSEALDFLEIDLESRGEETDFIGPWREAYVTDPNPPPKQRPGRGRRRGGRRRGGRGRRGGGAGGGKHAPSASDGKGQGGRGARSAGGTSGKKSKSKKKSGGSRRRRGGRSRKRSAGKSASESGGS